MGSIRKGQLTILEEVKNISQQMSSHFPLTQAGASNQLPEQPSQNLEQSGKPASQQFELSNQPSTSQQSLIDLDLEERETRELLDSLSSHNTIDDLSMSRASSVVSVNADPDFDWAQPLPSQQSNFAQTTPTTSAQKPFYPAPSTSVALPLYQANPASPLSNLALPRPASPAYTPAMPFYHTNPAPSIPNSAMPNPASTPAMPFYQANPASSISYPRYVQPSPYPLQYLLCHHTRQTQPQVRYLISMRQTQHLSQQQLYPCPTQQMSILLPPQHRTIGVAPLRLMPAHTCSFNGCFGRGLRVAASPILR